MSLHINTNRSGDMFSPLHSPTYDLFSGLSSGVSPIVSTLNGFLSVPNFHVMGQGSGNMEGFGGAIVSPYSAMSLSQYFSSGATEGMDATMSESGASCSGSSSNSSGSKMSSPEDQQFQLPSNILFGGDLKVENESGLDYQYQMLDPGAIFRNMNCHQYQPQLMTGFHLQSEALHNELPQQVGQLQTQIPQQEIPYAHITVCENCGTFETCMWRRGGIDGNQILCNRCGLYFNRKGHHRPDLKRKPSIRRRRPSNRLANLSSSGQGQDLQEHSQSSSDSGSVKGVTKSRTSSFGGNESPVVTAVPNANTMKKEDNGQIQLALAPDQINTLLNLLSQTSMTEDGNIELNAGSMTCVDLDQLKQLSGLLGYLTKILEQ